MKNIWLMTWFTLREAMARKVFLFFMGISALVLLILAVVFSFIDTDKIIQGMNFDQNKELLSELIFRLELMIVTPLASLGLLLAIFSSSSFVPSMLEKGNIDLLLSKPVSRDQLYIGKYLGGLLVVVLNLIFLVTGVWLIISMKFGWWDPGFLSVILFISFTFAILYGVIVLLSVATKSAIPGMMTAYFIFLILSPLLYSAKYQFNEMIKGDFYRALVDGGYYFFPKTQELMGTVMMNFAGGKGISDYQPIITSLLFLFLTLIYGLYIFRRKDF